MSTVEPGAEADPNADGPTFRASIEFLIGLVLGISLLKAFIAEAFLVPTGSMAPSLLGFHARIECGNCGHAVNIGTDTDGRVDGTPRCSQCGQTVELSGATVAPGDRLLVQKWLYSYRSPRRWETIVFNCPDQPQQAYVKRVVGLPGEAVQIIEGDIHVDGRIARKSLEEFATLAIPVFAHRRLEDKIRWSGQSSDSGWQVDADGLEYSPPQTEIDAKPGSTTDFLVYKHHDSEGRPSPITDETEYTRSRPLWDHAPIADILAQFRITAAQPTGETIVRLHPIGTHEFLLRLDFARGVTTLEWNGEPVRSGGFSVGPTHEISFGYFDQRAALTIDGQAPFAPFDVERPLKATANSTPLAFAADGQALRVDRILLFRDVYYSSRIANNYGPAGVSKPYKLADDEYFVLGDNSPISHDSRAWERPAVAARQLIGKPMFVHLPSRNWHWEAFGRKFRRPAPDVTKIRRIH